MKKQSRFLLPISMLLAGCSLGIEYQETGSTVDAYQDPVQRAVQGESFTVDGLVGSCDLQPRASIVMQGRVLHTRHYDLDWRSVCSPLDIALGWGPVADPGVDEWINWRQSRRWYFYTIQPGAPVSVQDVARHSSNVHIIPANNNLSRALLKLEVGDLVFLEGELVDAEVDLLGMSFVTRTSLTRTDSGGGACEILYVRRLVVDGKEFR